MGTLLGVHPIVPWHKSRFQFFLQSFVKLVIGLTKWDKNKMISDHLYDSTFPIWLS